MQLPELLSAWSEIAWLRAIAILVGAILVAFVVNLVVTRVLKTLARKTVTELDDKLIAILHRPLAVTVIATGAYWAIAALKPPDPIPFITAGFVKSTVIIVWSLAFTRIAVLLLDWLAHRSDRYRIVQERTLPIFEILAKVLIVGGAIYMALLSWNIDVTGWLASAGVVGIAVGFAAKDTLANLFSGVFILADAPYKIGDFVVLGSGERGMVTDIGIRSTRILTRDDVEITVPNAVIGNAKIVNESGGPHEKERVRVTVSVAYGSDVAQVKAVLMAAAQGDPHIIADPEPRVRFREFGDSGLVFQLMGWVDEPVLRGRALDSLNTAVYEGLNAAGIEIPYSKMDLYVKETPKG